MRIQREIDVVHTGTIIVARVAMCSLGNTQQDGFKTIFSPEKKEHSLCFFRGRARQRPLQG